MKDTWKPSKPSHLAKGGHLGGAWLIGASVEGYIYTAGEKGAPQTNYPQGTTFFQGNITIKRKESVQGPRGTKNCVKIKTGAETRTIFPTYSQGELEDTFRQIQMKISGDAIRITAPASTLSEVLSVPRWSYLEQDDAGNIDKGEKGVRVISVKNRTKLLLDIDRKELPGSKDVRGKIIVNWIPGSIQGKSMTTLGEIDMTFTNQDNTPKARKVVVKAWPDVENPEEADQASDDAPIRIPVVMEEKPTAEEKQAGFKIEDPSSGGITAYHPGWATVTFTIDADDGDKVTYPVKIGTNKINEMTFHPEDSNAEQRVTLFLRGLDRNKAPIRLCIGQECLWILKDFDGVVRNGSKVLQKRLGNRSIKDVSESMGAYIWDITNSYRYDFKVRLTGKGHDRDKDGVSDYRDNCPYNKNPEQKDHDNDGAGNTCDPNYHNYRETQQKGFAWA
ncbi:MAG: thrombospondin type 3 repeat-containing protein, partial [Candidatus Aenigmatarchaeota archaeon]